MSAGCSRGLRLAEQRNAVAAHDVRDGKHTNGHHAGSSNGHRNGQNGKAHGAVNGTHAPHASDAQATARPGQLDLASAQAKVIASVARISASPLERLKPTTKLGSDLGFDSLMVVELASQLAEELPGLGMLPKTLFARDLSIQDVAKHVVSTLGAAQTDAATATRAQEPVRFARHRVVLRPAPLPKAPSVGFAGPVVLLGGGARLGDLHQHVEVVKQ